MKNVDKALESIAKMRANNITEEWQNKTYNKDDYVIFDNQLWKCKATTNTMPSESIYWTKTSVSEELKALEKTLV